MGTRGLYTKGLSRAQGISAGSIYSDWVFASYSLGAVATERGHPVRLSAQREQPFKVILFVSLSVLRPLADKMSALRRYRCSRY